MDNPHERPPLPNGPPPNFPWPGQPNPNWGFIPPNYPPPPPPTWPLPFPPPLTSPGFPPPLLPPAPAINFQVPPPPPFPPPPGPPPPPPGPPPNDEYTANSSCTSSSLLNPLVETIKPVPKIKDEASQTVSSDISTAVNEPDTNAEAKANSSSQNKTKSPKNSSRRKRTKTDSPKKLKDLNKDSGSSRSKSRHRKPSSTSDKKQDREPTTSPRGKSKSSNGVERDRRKDRSHEQSHHSRSRDIHPPRHSLQRDRDGRERSHDHGSNSRHRERHSRSPSFSRHGHDPRSRASVLRDHDRRSRYHSHETHRPHEAHHSRRHRSRSPLRKREEPENKDCSHSKPRAYSEAGDKTSSKPKVYKNNDCGHSKPRASSEAADKTSSSKPKVYKKNDRVHSKPRASLETGDKAPSKPEVYENKDLGNPKSRASSKAGDKAPSKPEVQENIDCGPSNPTASSEAGDKASSKPEVQENIGSKPIVSSEAGDKASSISEVQENIGSKPIVSSEAGDKASSISEVQENIVFGHSKPEASLEAGDKASSQPEVYENKDCCHSKPKASLETGDIALSKPEVHENIDVDISKHKASSETGDKASSKLKIYENKDCCLSKPKASLEAGHTVSSKLEVIKNIDDSGHCKTKASSRAVNKASSKRVVREINCGHIPKASSEVGDKCLSKPGSENQLSKKTIPDQSSDTVGFDVVEKNKCVKKVQCKDETKKAKDQPSKAKRQKSRDKQSEKKSPRSRRFPRNNASKPGTDHHPFRSRVRPSSIPLRRKMPRRRKQDEDQPALSTLPSKRITCTKAKDFYVKPNENSAEVVATEALKELQQRFQKELLDRADAARALKPKYEPPVRKTKLRKHKPPETHSSDESSYSELESSSDDEDTAMEELERKRQHPDRLHTELWFNDPKEMNDGPLCRCSAKSRRSGIRHGIYVGEAHLPLCDPYSNNANRLHHYKIAITPVTNFLTNSPTVIKHHGRKYIFEGFSLLSHTPIPKKLPPCRVIRFNYEYTLLAVAEPMPCHFTVNSLELFNRFLLKELLELADLDWRAHEDPEGCPLFHFLPRFARVCDDDSKELLSFNVVLDYLLSSNELVVPTSKLDTVNTVSNERWQSTADKVKGMIVTSPGMKPSAVRVDQLDREHIDSQLDPTYPVIVHFGVRPPQLSYAGNPQYQKAWRDYVKYRHLLANKPKVDYIDKHKLLIKETKLQEMRMENDLKRDVTVVISSKGFYKTGIMSDIVQHAMLLPILVCHLRFHNSLSFLEETIGYKFKDRFLLQLALTHPSYRENFGTNPDHARNSLTNCGLRQPQYGDRRIHYMNTRKRGINTLINIMSRFGMQRESASSIHHNERLEFLGDAVVEFLSSIHLFYLFPDLEEGGLATYRAAIVQNQHLAVLAKRLQLEKFMLYAHGSDLCHDLELRHAMANCFEALMGALFLDGGIEVADKVFSKTLFPEQELQEVWNNYPQHPLQEQEPDGDRKWIATVPLLQRLHEFEKLIGIEFTHIRLLARALTHRSLGYNNLTLGSNQRLEFLGDTVLQLVASEYLYKFFPQHHEGHLSLLRSSIVNNRTQAVVCKDLGMIDYAIYPVFKVELKPKDKADLLEAFLGALYVDKDLGYCRKFCQVCFFPRLQDFIMNQDWNDPKSKLQQCCLTLRSMDGGEPDIPTYKVIECKGPTNTRVYAVAVYFQGRRLAVGSGHSIQQAEMDAANNALMKSQDLFPQLKHQKRAIERSLKQGPSKRSRKRKVIER